MKRAVQWLKHSWGRAARVDHVAACYSRVFAKSEEGRTVLADLARFCFVTASPQQADPATVLGMQTVFRHIVEAAHIEPGDLVELFKEDTRG